MTIYCELRSNIGFRVLLIDNNNNHLIDWGCDVENPDPILIGYLLILIAMCYTYDSTVVKINYPYFTSVHKDFYNRIRVDYYQGFNKVKKYFLSDDFGDVVFLESKKVFAYQYVKTTNIDTLKSMIAYSQGRESVVNRLILSDSYTCEYFTIGEPVDFTTINLAKVPDFLNLYISRYGYDTWQPSIAAIRTLLACIFAESNGIELVVIGNENNNCELETDSFGLPFYSDSYGQSDKFLQELNRSINLSGISLNVIAPTMHLTILDEFLITEKFGINNILSCFNSKGGKTCGVCPKCELTRYLKYVVYGERSTTTMVPIPKRVEHLLSAKDSTEIYTYQALKSKVVKFHELTTKLTLPLKVSTALHKLIAKVNEAV